MASYRRAINQAIKAAGYAVEEFEVWSTGFEPNWERAGLAGTTNDLDNRPATEAQNWKVRRVARELVKMGHRATIYTAGHGGMFVEVDKYRHSGHDADYSAPHSVWHY